MKRIFSFTMCLAMLASLLVLFAPSASAAKVGYWIDRKGDELNEPYEEAKDETYEPIPGSITSSDAFGIAGATFSLPIGKKAFKVSFDLTWVSPKRFSEDNESTSIRNFFIWVNYTYTRPDEMEPWGGFNSPGPWETWSDGNFAIWANKVGTHPIVEQIESGGKVVTTSLVGIEEGQINLHKEGTVTVTLELKNNVVSLNLKNKSGKDLGTAKHTYISGFFNDKTERYFAITHFNGAFVFDITNFKIISSDIPSSVGATAGARPTGGDNPSAVTSSQKPSSTSSAAAGDTSSSPAATSDSNSDESQSPSDESRPAGDASKAVTTSQAETGGTNGGGNNTLAIVLIIAAVVILAAAGILLFLKRKRKA